MSAEISSPVGAPVPATEEPAFDRHSRNSSFDSQSDVLDPSSASSDNGENENFGDGPSEEHYREEEDPLRENKFRSLTGASPRVNGSRHSRESSPTQQNTGQVKQNNYLAPPGGMGDQNGASHDVSNSENEVNHMGPGGHGFPDQEAYDRALLHGDEYDEVGDGQADDTHLHFEDRGVELDLDVDTEDDESCSDDDSSGGSDEDDWGRILQRPCDVRKVAPLGVDVTSPKFDGRTSQEFLEAVSPRFENTQVHSPRPNLRKKLAQKQEVRKRGVTFNEQTMTLLSSGETQLSPLIDEDDEDLHGQHDDHDYNDPEQWTGPAYDHDDDDEDPSVYGGRHLQATFPTIEVSEMDSPRSDDDSKRHDEMQKISIPVCLEAIANLEKKLRLSADKLADAHHDLEDTKQQLEDKHDAFCEQQGQIADLQEEVESLREKMEDLHKCANESNEARKAAVSELESQKQMMNLQDSTLERLKSTMSMKTEKLEQIEDLHKTELKRVRDSLQTECDTLRERNTKLSKDNTQLRAQLSDLLTNTRALRDTYSRVRTSLHTQAETAKVVTAATRSTKPRAEWDKAEANAARKTAATKNGASKKSSLRRNGAPTRRQEGASPSSQSSLSLWAVLIPSALLAMGLIAKSMSSRS